VAKVEYQLTWQTAPLIMLYTSERKSERNRKSSKYFS
jgi:hypothetical protein